jgi:hypothetical protein
MSLHVFSSHGSSSEHDGRDTRPYMCRVPVVSHFFFASCVPRSDLFVPISFPDVSGRLILSLGDGSFRCWFRYGCIPDLYIRVGQDPESRCFSSLVHPRSSSFTPQHRCIAASLHERLSFSADPTALIGRRMAMPCSCDGRMHSAHDPRFPWRGRCRERERENGERGSIPSPLLARERDGRGQGPRLREIQ